MDQMQMGMLQLMQAVAAQQQVSKPQKKEDAPEKSEFRDMMKQQKAEQEKTPEKPEAAEKTDSAPKAETTDTAALQQLAAMQLFCADTTKIAAPEENIPQVQLTVDPLAPQQEVTENLAQPLAAQPEAAAQKAPQLTDAQPTAVEADAAPVAEEAIKAPQQTDGQSGELKQETAPEQKSEAAQHRDRKIEDKVESFQAEGTEERVFTKVETAPVKVSETAAKLPKAKEITAQVTEKLTQAITKGEPRVEIQLTPANLGRIAVELTQKGDGTLQIVLHAENSQTRMLLERELPAMQGMLSRDTQQSVQVQVPREESAQRQDLYENPQHQQHRQQEQQEHQQHQSTEDFLNQLRLGLVPGDEAVS